MTEVLLVLIVVFGAFLNLLANPWSATESVLERRRNDIIILSCWILLLDLAILTVITAATKTADVSPFDLQDWTAITLPFALAAPYIMETVATLVRQVEMIPWIRTACVKTLPIAWMSRTMTIGEVDDDGLWLLQREWASEGYDTSSDSTDEKRSIYRSPSFWRATSREASLSHLYRKWYDVLYSATCQEWRKVSKLLPTDPFKAVCAFLLATFLTGSTAAIIAMRSITAVEMAVLLVYDWIWWVQSGHESIIARYDTMHFGRAELQSIFEQSQKIRTKLRHKFGNDEAPTDSTMGAVLTAAATFENSFRKAYLVSPVYKISISNRKVLRNQYDAIGLDVDALIKSVRALLEIRHTAGLLSITSGSGTIEADLHNRIEHILSVALFFSPRTMYEVAAHAARIEQKIEQRIKRSHASNDGETTVRERVVYIDARNALLHLLWVRAARDWNKEFMPGLNEEYGPSGQLTELEMDIYYVIATFLSRCRYCHRYGFESEGPFYAEVREICERTGKALIVQEYERLDSKLKSVRDFGFLEWTTKEYKLQWKGRVGIHDYLQCSWMDDDGVTRTAPCCLSLSNVVDFAI